MRRLIACLLTLCCVSLAAADRVTLTWQAPIANVDGTAVDDLAGYVVSYGRWPGEAETHVTLGLLLSTTIDGLDPSAEYAFAVRAYDSSWNLGPYSETVRRGPLAVHPAPVVQMTAPVTGTRVRGRVYLKVSATAPAGIDRVEVLINGVLRCIDRKLPYICRWDVPLASGRSYQIVARATDTTGHVGLSPAVTLTSK